ncbi:GNAT family N-acetyltransferase [Streptococcus merionis]|uniref:GNAT family N-acetyltransferase n=1 Tax=Streptococcus merionis TaxID=400065 RepID=UPI0026EE5754|nr:GNAT family N-acetyltransferase [Streptococcus merionis]
MLEIRPLSLQDEQAFFDYQQALLVEDNPFLDVYIVKDFQAFLEKAALYTEQAPQEGMSRLTHFYGFYNGTIVGQVDCFWDSDKPVINELGHVGYKVARPYRRQGFAQELLQFARKAFAKRGEKQILLTVLEANRASRALLEKLGAVEEGLTAITYQSQEVTVARYWLKTGE